MIGGEVIGKKAFVSIRPNYRRVNKNGKYTLHLYASYNNEKRDWGLKVYLSREEWDKLKSDNLRDERLREIKSIIRDYETRATKLIKKLGDDFSFDVFYQIVFNKIPRKLLDAQDVFAAINTKISELNKDQVGTKDIYLLLLKTLHEFKPHLKFKDITVDFLKGYEKYLVHDKNNSPATVGMYMRNLRHIVRRAIANKIIMEEDYPFGQEIKGKYEIPSGKGQKSPLDKDDVIKLLNYNPPTPAQDGRIKCGYLFLTVMA